MSYSSLVIVSHIGKEYCVVKRGGDISGYNSIYISSDRRRISKPYDMELRVGGMRMYILKDGTLVNGYNTFDKEDLAKVFVYLSE